MYDFKPPKKDRPQPNVIPCAACKGTGYDRYPGDDMEQDRYNHEACERCEGIGWVEGRWHERENVSEALMLIPTIILTIFLIRLVSTLGYWQVYVPALLLVVLLVFVTSKFPRSNLFGFGAAIIGFSVACSGVGYWFVIRESNNAQLQPIFNLSTATPSAYTVRSNTEATARAHMVETMRAPTLTPVPSPTLDMELVRIRYFLDGDTLELWDGLRVRLKGIDALELGSTPKTECAEAAPRILNDTLELRGATVYLINPAEVPNTDRYGRLLRYVETIEGKDIGEWVLGSFAEPAYDSRDGYEWHPREDRYHKYYNQKRTRAKQMGWPIDCVDSVSEMLSNYGAGSMAQMRCMQTPGCFERP